MLCLWHKDQGSTLTLVSYATDTKPDINLLIIRILSQIKFITFYIRVLISLISVIQVKSYLLYKMYYYLLICFSTIQLSVWSQVYISYLFANPDASESSATHGVPYVLYTIPPTCPTCWHCIWKQTITLGQDGNTYILNLTYLPPTLYLPHILIYKTWKSLSV